MRHYDKLIERYWIETAPLSAEELTRLKSHLIDCERCLDLMCAYEHASKAMDEVLRGDDFDDSARESEIVENLVGEFLTGWHAGEQYRKLSWSVVKEKLTTAGNLIENIHYPDTCSPDMSAFQAAGDEQPELGDCILIHYGEMPNSRIWTGEHGLGFENLEAASPLTMIIRFETGAETSLSPRPGERLDIPAADLAGRRFSVIISVENPSGARKTA